MEKLSNYLMNLQSPIYLEYLEHISRNVPYLSHNLKFENGKTFLEVSDKENRYALIFPTYGWVDERVETLQTQRNTLFIRYRFLRNKLLFSEDKSTSVNIEYDNVVNHLSNIDAEISLLESYKRVLNSNKEQERSSLIDTRHTLEADGRQAAKQEQVDILKVLAILKSIKAKDELLRDLHDNHTVGFYIESLPRKAVMAREQVEVAVKKEKKTKQKNKGDDKPKKRGRPPKAKQEGGTFKTIIVDNDKLKLLVKRRIKFSSKTRSAKKI